MHSPLSSCKNLPPYFFMVHLLRRLYGVDAPDYNHQALSAAQLRRAGQLATADTCNDYATLRTIVPSPLLVFPNIVYADRISRSTSRQQWLSRKTDKTLETCFHDGVGATQH